MKTIQFKNLASLLILLVLFAASPVFGQQRHSGSKDIAGTAFRIPDLTEEQQKKMDELSIPHQKKMLQLKNQLNEKNAALNSHRTADKVDMNLLNKTIDEIGAIRTQMMKERENHHQQTRGILTEKQRVIFDSHQGIGRGKGHKGSMYKGVNTRNANSPERGN